MNRHIRRSPGRLGIRIRASLALGAVGCLGVGGTYASWTDSAPVSGVTISAGRLDLKVNGADAVTNFSDLGLSEMKPGNTSAGVLTVRNNGNVSLNYSVDATATGAIGDAIMAKVTPASSANGSGAGRTCPKATLPNSADHFTSDFVGSPKAPRRLNADESETLCIQATLPKDADSSLQGGSSAISFTFHARQVT